LFFLDISLDRFGIDVFSCINTISFRPTQLLKNDELAFPEKQLIKMGYVCYPKEGMSSTDPDRSSSILCRMIWNTNPPGRPVQIVGAGKDKA
jgi:hypothetical protein